jgi:hypothetical protein
VMLELTKFSDAGITDGRAPSSKTWSSQERKDFCL